MTVHKDKSIVRSMLSLLSVKVYDLKDVCQVVANLAHCLVRPAVPEH